MYDDGESSDSRPCGEHCAWTWNGPAGVYELVHGCEDDNKGCRYPVAVRRSRPKSTTCTECTPLPDVEKLVVAEYRERTETRRYVVMLPKIENPKEIARAVNVIDADGSGQFLSTSFGWMLRLRHRAANGAPATYAPSTLPLEGHAAAERALTVGLKLQEGERLNEYWAPVTASRPWCVLTTSEWDVLIVALRSLVPAEAE